MSFTEKQVRSEKIFDGRIMKVYRDDVELDDNSRSVREYIRHTGGAAVLFIKEGKVALVKQFRYVYGREIYEIPAGKMGKGEDPAVAAARELEEETGYVAEVKKLAEIYPSPGYTDEVIHIYLAENARFAGQKPDEGEFLTCEFVPISEVVKMIERGEICDAKTVTAIYKYLYEKQA